MTQRRTPEQQAAMDRAKKPPSSPFRAWHGGAARRDRDPETIVPRRGRLVRA